MLAPHWLPDWLYKSLPALYAAGGSATWVALGDMRVAQISAALLLIAAMLVVFRRQAARRARVAGSTPRAAPGRARARARAVSQSS